MTIETQKECIILTKDDIESWKKEYEQRRYLQHASADALEARCTDLAQNLWATDRDGNVTQPRYSDHRFGIIRLYAHTLLEITARTTSGSFTFDEEAIRLEASATYQPPNLNTKISFDPTCISKFGQKEHIQGSLKMGKFRIAPASSYDDPSLNAAQMDQELENFSRTSDESLMFTIYGSTTMGGEGKEINVERQELFRYKNSPDFYVWSCALSYDARMFHDFKANAALIVHDQSEFKKRLNAAVAKKLSGSRAETGELEYYDPYNIKHDNLHRGFSKDIKYLYQNEFRFAWWVSETDNLKPFFIEMGSIEDIASVVELCT